MTSYVIDGCSEQTAALYIVAYKLNIAEDLFQNGMFYESSIHLSTVLRCVDYLPYSMQIRSYELEDNLNEAMDYV